MKLYRIRMLFGRLSISKQFGVIRRTCCRSKFIRYNNCKSIICQYNCQEVGRGWLKHWLQTKGLIYDLIDSSYFYFGSQKDNLIINFSKIPPAKHLYSLFYYIIIFSILLIFSIYILYSILCPVTNNTFQAHEKCWTQIIPMSSVY